MYSVPFLYVCLSIAIEKLYHLDGMSKIPARAKIAIVVGGFIVL